MRPIVPQPSLVDQVAETIVSEIVSGDLPSNSRLIQDDLARAYGVSRQPIQQALLLLRNQGLIREASGRGLIVAPLDIAFVRNLYEIRAVLDGLAASLAAMNVGSRTRRDGRSLVAAGRSAVKQGTLAEQIAADMAFHAFISDLSGNPLIAETTAPHWPSLRRVMAEVLRDADQMPRTIWDEHAAILDAVAAGDAALAETLSRKHIADASVVFIGRLQAKQDAISNGAAVGKSRRLLRAG